MAIDESGQSIVDFDLSQSKFSNLPPFDVTGKDLNVSKQNSKETPMQR